MKQSRLANSIARASPHLASLCFSNTSLTAATRLQSALSTSVCGPCGKGLERARRFERQRTLVDSCGLYKGQTAFARALTALWQRDRRRIGQSDLIARVDLVLSVEDQTSGSYTDHLKLEARLSGASITAAPLGIAPLRVSAGWYSHQVSLSILGCLSIRRFSLRFCLIRRLTPSFPVSLISFYLDTLYTFYSPWPPAASLTRITRRT